jgi:cell wall-associated NlpC family hydrolase
MSAYASAGVSIPRTSRAQWTIGAHIGGMTELVAGDLVFYADGSSASTIHHVGLYIGDGLMVEAPFTGANVRIASINRPDYFGATRPTGG